MFIDKLGGVVDLVVDDDVEVSFSVVRGNVFEREFLGHGVRCSGALVSQCGVGSVTLVFRRVPKRDGETLLEKDLLRPGARRERGREKGSRVELSGTADLKERKREEEEGSEEEFGEKMDRFNCIGLTACRSLSSLGFPSLCLFRFCLSLPMEFFSFLIIGT